MSTVQKAAQDYLQLRQSLGHKMGHAVRLLPRYVAYLDSQNLTTVTTATAIAWAEMHHATSGVQRERLSIARGFARFMTGLDPQTEIPPLDLIPDHYERRVPFIYSIEDIHALMGAARQVSRWPFRGTTVATVIGLLGVTGMRVGEALHLNRQAVDLEAGVLTIQAAKFGKSREVVLAPSTTQALQQYDQVRAVQKGCQDTPWFFVTEGGQPLQYPQVGQAVFRRLIRASGVGAESPISPHLHDLRHAFVVRTLVAWYHQGVDVEAWLPRLSTYLGHSSPRNTYWYVSAVPELLALAADRVAAWQTEVHQ